MPSSQAKPSAGASRYGPLADQLRRALLGAYLNLTEAAAALEAAVALGLIQEADATTVLEDLDRLAARLTRLGGFGG